MIFLKYENYHLEHLEVEVVEYFDPFLSLFTLIPSTSEFDPHIFFPFQLLIIFLFVFSTLIFRPSISNFTFLSSLTLPIFP